MDILLIDAALYLQRTYECAIAGAIMTRGNEVVSLLLASGWVPALDTEVIRLWKMIEQLPKDNHLLTRAGTSIIKARQLKSLIDWYNAYERIVPMEIQVQGAPRAVEWLLHETQTVKIFIATYKEIIERLEDIADERASYSRQIDV